MLKEFYKNEDGQGMIEYGLIIALISIVAIVAMKALGGVVGGNFEKAASALKTSAAG